MSATILLWGNSARPLNPLLTRVGFETVSANNGETLPELITSCPVDLIVVDDQELGSTLELLHFIRAHGATRLVPVVVISDSDELIKRTEDEGLDSVEVVTHGTPNARVLGRISTLLRIKKLDALDDRRVALSTEVEALRELNRSYLRDLEEARQIQQALLPTSLPCRKGFEIGIAYQPASQVGGDWYFVHEQQSGQVIVQVADVTGHGLAAALLGSMTRLAFSASWHLDPAPMLAEMNRLLAPQLPEGRFVSVGCLSYNPATGELSYTRAGHTPALLIRASTSEVQKLVPDGFAIGFFDDVSYTPEVAKLDPGDIVLLFSDGIIEEFGRGTSPFGTQRLGQIAVANSGAETMRGALEGIMDEFYTFLDGREPVDDVTLVALRRSIAVAD